MEEEDHNITLDIFQSVRILINRLSCRSESSNLSFVVYLRLFSTKECFIMVLFKKHSVL